MYHSSLRVSSVPDLNSAVDAADVVHRAVQLAVLESNTLELEESLAAYERGVVLLGSLQKRLGAAEQQVEVLMGELVAAPDDETQDTTLS